MKLARVLTVVGLGLSAVGAIAISACSSGDDSSSGGGGQTGAVPPALPSGAAATTATTDHNFALNALLLGDAPRGSTAQSPTAWKKFGYNIDGKISTASSTDLCTPAQGAQKSLVYTDGDNGIDNSFGENILPIILNTAGADATAKINQSIVEGAFTIEMEIKGLSDDAKQTNSGLGGFLNAAGHFNDAGTGPAFQPTDNWPVLNTLLTNPSDPSSSKINFPSAYVVNGTWVNGPFGAQSNDIVISISLSGVSLALTVHKAVLTFDHTQATHADNGTIAGVINTEELISGLKTVAGRISTQLCSGSAFDGIAQQIRQASDILSDGTNQAGKPCDGISIGLGFTALQIANQTQAVDPGSATSPDPCAGDGGTSGDGG